MDQRVGTRRAEAVGELRLAGQLTGKLAGWCFGKSGD